MMGYLPVCLDLSGRRCLVIGGGRVAERKVESLLRAGGRVRLISPEATEALAAQAEAGCLEWLRRSYRDGDLHGAFLAIAATSDTTVQEQVAVEAEAAGILLNVVDVPRRCSFIIPATVRRGDLQVSVSTGGNSPALAKKIRRELEDRFGPEYETLTALLGALRAFILARGQSQPENELLFTGLAREDIVGWILRREHGRILKHLEEVLSEPLPAGLRGELLRILGN